jgi:hypothetical protein
MNVTCEVQTFEKVMDEKFTSYVSEEKGEEEDDAGKSEPPVTFLSSLRDTHTVRKDLMKFDVCSMMPILSCIENKVYRVQQKPKKQLLILLDMWKKGTNWLTFLMQYFELTYFCNVMPY